MNQDAVFYMCVLTLTGCLAIACWRDFTSRRIPNAVVLIGALSGLLLQTTATHGDGLFVIVPGGLGGRTAFAGCVVGMLALLPMYAMRVMGAGDVKLMGMVGAFLGPGATLDAVLMTFLSGGILSMVVAARVGVLQAVLCNVRQAVTQSVVSAVWTRRPIVSVTPVAATSLPYAFAITAGTVAEILLARAGHTFFA